MTNLVVCAALLCAAPPETPLKYQDAHAQAAATKKPMLVLVGADWCPACRTMKYSTLPQMMRSGKLKDVLYTIVDVDEQPNLASQMMRSSSIPQLVLYAPSTKSWYRMYLQGSQNPEQISAMISQGLELQRQSLAAAETESENATPAASAAGGE